MRFLRKISPEVPLRLGLGATYVYSGLTFILYPKSWIWAVSKLPSIARGFIESSIGVDNFLRIQGVGELFLAAAMLAWFLPRWAVISAALIIVVHQTVIAVFVGVDLTTFRDLGLLGGGLALLLFTIRR